MDKSDSALGIGDPQQALLDKVRSSIQRKYNNFVKNGDHPGVKKAKRFDAPNS